MRALELKIPPVAVFVVTGAAMWALDRWLSAASLVLPGAAVLALLLAIVGTGFGVSALVRFRQHDTTFHPGKPGEASAMVTTGVYRLTRNPMYLALACLLAAWAFRLGNLAALLCVPLFMAYITRFQIMPEERALAALFGDSYRHYQSEVRRWI